MTIFNYGRLDEAGFVAEFSRPCLTIRRPDSDGAEIEEIFSRIPADLREEGLIYLYLFAINHQSTKLLRIAESLGLWGVKSIHENLEVAMTIRDAIFRRDEVNKDFLEILKGMSNKFGVAFALDCIDAAYERDNINSKIKNFPTTAERLSFYNRNLSLITSIFDDSVLKNTRVGNFAIGKFYSDISNIREKEAPELFAEQFNILSKFSFDDAGVISGLLNQNKGLITKLGAVLSSQVDAAFKRRIKNGFEYSGGEIVGIALKSRPLETLQCLLDASEEEISCFISSDTLDSFLHVDWINNDNLRLLENNNFFKLVEKASKRIMSNYYFDGKFYRDEYLNTPHTPSIVTLLMINNGAQVSLKTGGSGIEEFAKNLMVIQAEPHLKQVASASLEVIYDMMKVQGPSFYKKIYADDDVVTKMPNPETVDNRFMINYLAVRLYCESSYVDVKTLAAHKKMKPFTTEHDIPSSLSSRRCLQAIIHSLDEDFIVSSLSDYKAGYKPLIKAGILGNEFISKLPLKDRGEFLEEGLGV